VGGSSRVNTTGGVFGDEFDVSSAAPTTISGGTFGTDFDVTSNSSELNLIGTQFLLDGADMTAAIAQSGGMTLDPTNPPLLLEIVFTDGSTSTFQFVPEAPLQGPELSTLSPNATVNLIVGVPQIVGDYNANGFVSQGDLYLVLLNWGETVLPAGF
jgi:hypothetical protein